MDVMGYIREHPYQSGAIAAVAVVAVYLLVSGNHSSAPSSSQVADTNASYGLESQQLATDAALQAKQLEVNGQLAALQQSGANQIALATIAAQSQGDLQQYQYQAQITEDQLAHDLGISNIEGQITQAQLQAEVADRSISTSGAVQLAQVASTDFANKLLAETTQVTVATNAALQEQIAQINGQVQTQVVQTNASTQQTLANTAAQIQTTISNNQADVAKWQAYFGYKTSSEAIKAKESGGIFGSILGAAGSIVGALI